MTSTRTVTTNSGRRIHLFRSAGKGFGNSDSPIQHFGLGSDTSVERLDINWPSGITQLVLEPDVDRVHRVVESGILPESDVVVGEDLTLQAVGPPGHVVAIAVSTATADLPVPRFGGIALVGSPVPGRISGQVSRQIFGQGRPDNRSESLGGKCVRPTHPIGPGPPVWGVEALLALVGLQLRHHLTVQ